MCEPQIRIIVTDEALAAGKDFFVCKKHKTWKTYGDLAKKLTPGLLAALQAYDKLPRPAECDMFFVPVTVGAAHICIPSCLKRFCQRRAGCLV